MDLFSLLTGSGLARSNGPDRLIGNDDFAEFVSRQIEHAAFQFSLYHFVLLVGLALLQCFSDAEYHFQVILKSKHYFLLEYLRSLVIVFATL